MAGLSQNESADFLGYSRRQVVAWGSAKNQPPLSILPALREVFNVGSAWVVMGRGLKPLTDVGKREADRRACVDAKVTTITRSIGYSCSPKTQAEIVSLTLQQEPADEPATITLVSEILNIMATNKL